MSLWTWNNALRAWFHPAGLRFEGEFHPDAEGTEAMIAKIPPIPLPSIGASGASAQGGCECGGAGNREIR